MSLGPVKSFRHREPPSQAVTRKADPITADYVLDVLGADMRADILRDAEEARIGTGFTFDESVMVALRKWQKRWAS